MDKTYIHCNKNCIANLNGKCCVGECRGSIITLRPFRTNSEEQLKKIYEATKKHFIEDFEVDESIFEDEED